MLAFGSARSQGDRQMDNTPSGDTRWNIPDLQSVIERVRTESALNPLLWLSGLTLLAAVAASYFDGYLKWALFGMSALCVLVALVAYIYFMLRDPNRLHSERYQLERHKLDLMLDERFPGRLPVTIDVTPTSNTSVQAASTTPTPGAGQ
jgi:hypothetical protein